MNHFCTNTYLEGDWSVGESPKVIHCQKLFGKLKNKKIINFDEICWPYLKNPERLKFKLGKINKRYMDADIAFPGIVAEGVINPCNKKYRMVDGSHRLAKMILDYKIEFAEFYIISKKKFHSCLEDIV